MIDSHANLEYRLQFRAAQFPRHGPALVRPNRDKLWLNYLQSSFFYEREKLPSVEFVQAGGPQILAVPAALAGGSPLPDSSGFQNSSEVRNSWRSLLVFGRPGTVDLNPFPGLGIPGGGTGRHRFSNWIRWRWRRQAQSDAVAVNAGEHLVADEIGVSPLILLALRPVGRRRASICALRSDLVVVVKEIRALCASLAGLAEPPGRAPQTTLLDSGPTRLGRAVS